MALLNNEQQAGYTSSNNTDSVTIVQPDDDHTAWQGVIYKITAGSQIYFYGLFLAERRRQTAGGVGLDLNSKPDSTTTAAWLVQSIFFCTRQKTLFITSIVPVRCFG